MATWGVREDREIYHNPVLRLHLETIEAPGGRVGEWTVVDIGDGAAVLPVHADGSMTLIRQYRHAVGRWIYEIPAGRVESGESAEAAARRELREEAGLDAKTLEPLPSMIPLAGINRHVIHLFRATELSTVPVAHEVFEDIEIVRVSAAQIRDLAVAGEMECGIAMSALFLHQALLAP